MDEIAGQNRPGVVVIDDFNAFQLMLKSESNDRFYRDTACFLRKISARYNVPVICGLTLRQEKDDMDADKTGTMEPARFLSTVGEDIAQSCRTILWVHPKTGQPDDPEKNNKTETQIICRCMQSETDESDWASGFTLNTDTLKII